MDHEIKSYMDIFLFIQVFTVKFFFFLDNLVKSIFNVIYIKYTFRHYFKIFVSLHFSNNTVSFYLQ